MNSIYSVTQIAKYFISLANKEFIDVGVVEGITNLKLQKILYFAQASYLSVFDKPLFDEEIQAWKFGPVIPKIYHLFKVAGNTPIDISLVNDADDLSDEELKIFLDSVWNLYGKYSAAELVEITHNHKPWKEAFLKGEADAVISHDDMKKYYAGYFQLSEV